MRIIVTGLIGQYPLGGVTWDYFQYVLGLHQLGHEVFYIEDTGQWPYVPEANGLSKEGDYTVAYLKSLFERFGLSDRWAYCFPWQEQWFGLSQAKRREVIETAELLINVSGTLEDPTKYRARGRMAYIDSDPVFTQVKIAKGNDYFKKLIDSHDVTFSFGEALANHGTQGHSTEGHSTEGHSTESKNTTESKSTQTPDTGHNWLPTRQPMVLSEWPVATEDRGVYTTIMNWHSYKPIEFEGRKFGQKDIEFPAYYELPNRVQPIAIEVAANGGRGDKLPRELLAHRGWNVVDPAEVCPDLDSYRDYISSSRGEWSVAKSGYVAGQSGWFSCRSTCYLAAGRPVIVQDTGFSEVLPTGKGILAFRSLDEAVAEIKEVESDYATHRDAARSIAEQYFDSAKVLQSLIERAMNSETPREQEAEISG